MKDIKIQTMESINLRIDQLKGKEIAIICSDRDELSYIIELLEYDNKKFASCAIFPLAISAKKECLVSFIHNTYTFVSAWAVKLANSPQNSTEQRPKPIVVNTSCDNPAIMTAMIADLKSLGMVIPTDNSTGNIKTIYSHMGDCSTIDAYRIFYAPKKVYHFPPQNAKVFVIPEDYNKVLEYVKSAIAFYEKKEQAQKVVTIGNGKYSVIVSKKGVHADNKTISTVTIQDLLTTLTQHTFPWTVTVDSISIGCYKNITIKDLEKIIEAFNDLQKP